MDAMGIVIFLALMLFVISVILVFIAIFSLRSREEADKQIQNWKEIAERLGWTFDQKNREIIGVHRGVQIKVDQFEPGRSLLGGSFFIVGLISGREKQAARQLAKRVRVRMKITNPANRYMSLVGNGNRSSIENLIVRQATTFIEEIDNHFSVESQPKDFAANVLKSKQVRDQILELHQHSQISLAARKNELNFQVEGLNVSDDTILKIVNIACDLKEAVESVTA